MNGTLILILLVSFFSFVYSLAYVGESSYYFLYLLPLILFILSIVFNKVYEDFKNSFVFKILMIQIAIRYCVLPSLLSTGEYVKIGFGSSSLNIAVIIMILELFAIFIVSFLFGKLQKIAYLNRLSYLKPLKNIPLAVITLIVMIYYAYSMNVFELVNPIWGLDAYVEKYINNIEELDVSSYGVIVFNIFKTLLALTCISVIAKNDKIKDSNKKWFYLLTVLLANIYIVGTSRFSIILFSLPLLFLILQLIRKKDVRNVILISITSIFIVLISTSIAKYSRYGDTATVSSILTAQSLNAYFAGPGLIAVGLEASADISFYESILFFINDSLQNLPMLSSLTVDDYKANVIFNESIYEHRLYADQIVPMSISGSFHFGMLGVVIYSSLIFALALMFERLSYRTVNIGFKYIYIYLSISLSLVFMVNLSGTYAVLVRTFMFLFIPLLIITYAPKFKFK